MGGGGEGLEGRDGKPEGTAANRAVGERPPPRSAASFGRLKSTLGGSLAASGAWNSWGSLKPNIPAVMFEGNDRRWVL